MNKYIKALVKVTSQYEYAQNFRDGKLWMNELRFFTKCEQKEFCSFRCRMDYWNSHPEQVYRRAYYALVCKYCGRPFQSYGNAHRKFCCRSCYDEHRKRGKRHDE